MNLTAQMIRDMNEGIKNLDAVVRVAQTAYDNAKWSPVAIFTDSDDTLKTALEQKKLNADEARRYQKLALDNDSVEYANKSLLISTGKNFLGSVDAVALSTYVSDSKQIAKNVVVGSAKTLAEWVGPESLFKKYWYVFGLVGIVSIAVIVSKIRR